MDLFGGYRRRHRVRPALITTPPAARLFNVVVIPCYDEPEEEVFATLDALAACALPQHAVEVLLVVNTPENAAPAVAGRNRRLYHLLGSTLSRWEHARLALHPLLVEDYPPGEAGVGAARKTGMDEALYRLEAAGAGEEGIITSLDADTRVDKNYLTALEEMFLSRPRLNGVSICFEHPLEGPFPSTVYRGIVQYELHMRYFVQALRHIHYPYAYHTVGSAFAVRAGAYVRQGGMNKKQGGEDFYFLQKVIMAGRFADLTATCVRPSPRPARKVPFGTGPEMYRFMTGEKETFLTYDLRAFLDLEDFFRQVPELFETHRNPEEQYDTLPSSLQRFLPRETFSSRIREIRKNVSSQENFILRFFRWFNTFRVIKFLNSVHGGFYHRLPVTEAAAELLRRKGVENIPRDGKALLQYYREMERRADA